MWSVELISLGVLWVHNATRPTVQQNRLYVRKRLASDNLTVLGFTEPWAMNDIEYPAIYGL